MKSHLLLTTIAAVLLVGCGPSAPDISIYDAARDGNIEGVKQYIVAGVDLNAKNKRGMTPLHYAVSKGYWTFVICRSSLLVRRSLGKFIKVVQASL